MPVTVWKADAMNVGLIPVIMSVAVSIVIARYREMLREEMAQTLGSDEDIEDEVRHLFATLAGES